MNADPSRSLAPATWPSRPRVVTGAFTFVVGLWLVSAPAVVGYDLEDPITPDIITGVAVALLALARAGAYSEPTAHLAARGLWLLGAWLVVASAAVYETAAPSVNDLACGVLVLILAGANAALCRDAFSGVSARTGRSRSAASRWSGSRGTSQ